MRLYSGSCSNFIEDAARNQIAEKLKTAFFDHYRYNPSPGEINSWRNSLRAISQVFDRADLDDHGVLLEYQLPLTSRRLDCMVCGTNGKSDQAVIVELKQWDKCEQSDGEHSVSTWVGGAIRDVLHPSAQVGQYQRYLADTHTAFYSGDTPITLEACSYLHNYVAEPGDVILDESFQGLLKEYPLYTADDSEKLKKYLADQLSGGDGLRVLQRVEESKYKPSKKLMNHVGSIIKGEKDYILLDEQLVVYDRVLAEARTGYHDRKKAVIIVQGGPGTGKSVIAINLMADLLLDGYNAHYATGSRAFTQTLRKIIGPRGSVQFKYFNSYVEADNNEIDVLICDEAHRIRQTSANRFTAKAKRSDKPQIEELIEASKVAVFFVDDKQGVRPNEIGSSALIREVAPAYNCKTYDYKLEAQFRCSGSDAFVNWVNNTLGIERTANVLWEGDENFEFRIYGSPEELEAQIRKHVEAGDSARLVAGFCWPWAKFPMENGQLVEDVVIGDYRRPWNARPDAKKLAKGIPKAELWAHDDNGIEQVGCIYTAQGFEFDYVGVIFGPDLVYSFDSQDWIGIPENSKRYRGQTIQGKIRRPGEKHVSSASFARFERVLRPLYGY